MNVSTKNNDIKFCVSKAEEMAFLEPQSVDLITCFQAIHWFDRERFYKEVDRILRPEGVLAVVGYGKPVHENSEINAIIVEVNYILFGFNILYILLFPSYKHFT